MSQEYTIKDLKVTDFKDQHDNSWVNAAFEEFGEPVTIVVKDPSKLKVGLKLTGEIKTMTGKSGKAYNRFFRDKPQQQGFGGAVGFKGKRDYTPRDDAAIQAQWAIGQANQQVVAGVVEPGDIEALAKDFFSMIDRVKASKEEEQQLKDNPLDKQPVEKMGDPVSLADIPF